MSQLPDRLGQRFTLGAMIGRGTCSEVYRAHDLLLDRDAAVKVFPVADDPRIEREVSLLASLDHPSLVPVYDVGEVGGRAFVVMALLEGGNLVDRIAASGPLTVPDTLLAVAAVADALGHVRRAGVLHRDITPRNVLFDADGRAHLSDFGVAFVADAPRITDTGIVVGSAPYLAPEQVRGEDVGPPADVYALGLVMIEALTGRPVYEGSPLEAAHERLERPPTLPPALSLDVATMLLAMTADAPADRPAADAVCVGLRRAALAAETASFAVPTPAAAPTPITVIRSTGASAPVGARGSSGLGVVLATGPPRDASRSRPNARGLVVVGAAMISALLAGGVLVASAWTVDDVAVSAPPSASVAPTAGLPELPVVGGGFAPGGAEGGGSSSSDDASDGGNTRGSDETYAVRGPDRSERSARAADEPVAASESTAPSARASSSTEPTTTTPEEIQPVLPTPAVSPRSPRSRPGIVLPLPPTGSSSSPTTRSEPAAPRPTTTTPPDPTTRSTATQPTATQPSAPGSTITGSDGSSSTSVTTTTPTTTAEAALALRRALRN